MTTELTTFVCDQMAGDRVRRMFGGWAIYRDAHMVAVVYGGRVYVKAVTEEAQAKFIAAGMGPFRPRPQQTLKSFWELPPDVLDNAPALQAWLRDLA